MIAWMARRREPSPLGRGQLALAFCRALRRAVLIGAVAIIAGLLTIGASQAYSTGKGHAGKTAISAVSMSAAMSMSVYAATSSMASGAVHGMNPCENGSDEYPGSCCKNACCSSCTAATVGAIPMVLLSRTFSFVDPQKGADPPLGYIAPAFRPPRVYS